MVGYTINSKIIRVPNPKQRRVREIRNAIVIETPMTKVEQGIGLERGHESEFDELQINRLLPVLRVLR